MPLSPPATIGAQIAGDIAGLVPAAGTPITPTIIEAMWTAAVTRIYADLQSNAEVAPGTFTNGGGPVGGTGGPII